MVDDVLTKRAEPRSGVFFDPDIYKNNPKKVFRDMLLPNHGHEPADVESRYPVATDSIEVR